MSESKLTYALKGRLTLSRSGWLLLSVPNNIGNGLFQALSEHDIEQPLSESSGQYNAHVSVMRPEEIESFGGPDQIKARGQMVGFNTGQVKEISNPGTWTEVSKCWVIEVNSPELMKIRRSHGLGEPKYPFHITFAIRKKRTAKAASFIHMHKVAATSTEIKSSPIDGKGLFATSNFNSGDVIDPKYMVQWHDDDKMCWDQSEQCRFTNHSNNPNCTIVRDDDYVQLVAMQDIVRGEELTADYADCAPVLGNNSTFTYRGKPYNGESEANQKPHDVKMRATRTILQNLYGNSSE